jgi:5-methylcytosine-specific restriction protein A
MPLLPGSHRPKWFKDGARKHERKKPDNRIRSYRGERIRAQVLLEEPLCRVCEARGEVSASEQVDHIVPLHQGGTNDRANLQGICKPCHKEKTKLEARARLAGKPQ